MTEEQKARRRAQQRAYYWANRDYILAQKRAWHAANPGYAAQADRDRYMLEPEKRKAHFRTWYAANRERINVARREKRINYAAERLQGECKVD